MLSGWNPSTHFAIIPWCKTPQKTRGEALFLSQWNSPMSKWFYKTWWHHLGFYTSNRSTHNMFWGKSKWKVSFLNIQGRQTRALCSTRRFSGENWKPFLSFLGRKPPPSRSSATSHERRLLGEVEAIVLLGIYDGIAETDKQTSRHSDVFGGGERGQEADQPAVMKKPV